MLIDNSKKIVIKLGSTTVIDKKGNFKKAWVNSLIKDIKKTYDLRDELGWQMEKTRGKARRELYSIDQQLINNYNIQQSKKEKN